jgi:peptidyl-prolyl cis-trans isomerase A (cyclophilin A)
MRALLLLALCVAAFAQPAQPPKPDEPGLYATFDTTFGIIHARLLEKEALNTVRNFVGLVQGTRPWNDPVTRKIVAKPFYKNLLFHRVIPYFMVQTGDPTGVGNHDCGFLIPDEIVPGLNFDVPGRLAMANIGKPNSGACQIFFTEVADTKMNGKYTIFGQVVEGMDVVKKLSRVIVGENDKPRFPLRLKNVTLKRVFPNQP